MSKKRQIAAVVLSHRRPFNIQRILDSILQVRDINTIIVSNDNPEVNITKYLSVSDHRVILHEYKSMGRPVRRYEIATAIEAHYYICIDDDLFLDHTQVEYLLSKLIENPTAPHGFWGQTFTESGNDIIFENGVINMNRKVDILNRAYFFSSAHLTELMHLIQQTNTAPEDIGPCDDIFLSFSGQEKPFSHNISGYDECKTSNLPGIAQWKDIGFVQKREEILKKILMIKRFRS